MGREDRRGAHRVRAGWPVQLESPQGETVSGHVSDISTSGLRVQVPIELAADTPVTLRLTLPGPPDRVEVVAVGGRVVRSDGEGIAVDVISAGGGLPERAMRRVRPRLDNWETRRRSPRVHLPVVVTLGHEGGAQVPAETVDLNDPNFQSTAYDPFVAYGRSKTANILFAVAFDQRHRGRGVRAAAVHPGGIHTELGRHMDSAQLHKMIDQMNQQLAAEGKPPFEWKTIPQGAATSVWAGFVAPADEVGGRYCENCHVGTIVPDDVVISAISEGVRGYALDPQNAEALWKKSEELVGETF